MCVKEFLGYSCGHCSVPFLRQCPIAASQPLFPNCKFPAERPIFTNDNCHPCSRVLWNIKVLREEEAHREQHLRQECECEVMFNAEERERRLRPRPNNNKKAKNREIMGAEQQLHGSNGENSHPGNMGGSRLANEPGGAEPGGNRNRRDNEEHSVPMTPQTAASQPDPSSYQRPSRQASTAQAGPSRPPYQPPNYNFRDPYQTQAFNGAPSSQAGPSQKQAQATSVYDTEYVGYFINRGHADMNHVASGNGFPHGGVIPEEIYWRHQAQLGQPGAGMKWYPQDSALLPEALILPTLPPAPAAEPSASQICLGYENPRPVQKAKSEPYRADSPEMNFNELSTGETTEATEIEAKHQTKTEEAETEDEESPSGPLVVSSDMALPKSV